MAVLGLLLTIAGGALWLFLRDTSDERSQLGDLICYEWTPPPPVGNGGLGQAEPSPVKGLPVPDAAEPAPCGQATTTGGPYDINRRSYVLAADVTVEKVTAWYEPLGLSGKPWGSFEWCGEERAPDFSTLSWVDRDADRVLWLNVAVFTDLLGLPGEGFTHVDLGTADRSIEAPDEALC